STEPRKIARDRIVLIMGARSQLWSIAKMSVTGGVIGVTISDRYVTVVAIKGHSMHPTMTATDSALRGDIVLAEKACLDQYKFSRGDVILFKCPSNHKEVFVKRLIGLPGEWIQLPASSEIIKVPQGHCWVEGDNAARSWDSRSFGPLCTRNMWRLAVNSSKNWHQVVLNNLASFLEYVHFMYGSFLMVLKIMLCHVIC
uniref:Mitochondrial inner membrane protease subunit 2 n=1 Tax=Aegilops tauschii subsp. strangulata TaxID=200361 RepID=A0A453J0R4_AEGTS